MSETMGRCRSEVDDCYGSLPLVAIADAIDRLAADVAAVKDMAQEIALRVPSELGRDACDAAVRVLEKERDAAIRERDKARAEAQRIQDEADDQEQTDKVKRLNAEIDKMHYTLMNRTWERDEARAEVERLTARLGDRAEVQQTQLSAAFTEGTLQAGDAMRARFEQVEKERDDARAEVERLKAELAARRSMAPVVEVPAMPLEVGDANTHTGQYLRGRRDIAVSYRAALDKAGVAWKEVPRE